MHNILLHKVNYMCKLFKNIGISIRFVAVKEYYEEKNFIINLKRKNMLQMVYTAI